MNMNITPQDILLSALLTTITAALLATVHAVTEEAYDAIAEALEILREALSTPNLRVPSNTFNGPLIGSELDGRIGAIHIGSCRGSGRIDPDAEAHAHIDGSAEICIFQMPESRAQMEWLIAHETAHLIAEREAQHHGQAWQAQVARLGYPEEIEPHVDTHMEMFKPAAAESRSIALRVGRRHRHDRMRAQSTDALAVGETRDANHRAPPRPSAAADMKGPAETGQQGEKPGAKSAINP